MESDGETGKCEVDSLLTDEETKQNTEGDEDYEHPNELSKHKQRILIASVLCLQFASLCVDTAIFPFFPEVGRENGLTVTQIGIVFSAYDFARFVVSPICGSLVR